MTTTMDTEFGDPSSLLNNFSGGSLAPRGEPSRLQRAQSYHSKPNFFLSDPSPETVLPLLQQTTDSNPTRSALVLRHALWWAVEHGDNELVTWLTLLPGEWGELLTAEIAVMEDEDGWGLVGITVQSSCGRPDKEDIVRAVVAKWGLETGPRGGRDRAGWTPLHLAALISTPPLVSFLLNRGASPLALTNRGLTPFDLISGMKDREPLALILDPSQFDSATLNPPGSALGFASQQQQQQERPGGPQGESLSASRRNMLERRRRQTTRRAERAEKSAAKGRLAQERERLIRERAKVVGVEPELIIPTTKGVRESPDSGVAWLDGDDQTDTEDESDSEATNYQDPNSAFLVFSLSSLPSLLDDLVTTYKPVCFPLSKRTTPANALYLYARFAHYKCDQSWLEELIEGAVEKIESGVYNNVENLAYLAFWAYNTTLLLYLVCLDEPLRLACEDLNLLSMMEELINAIHVFIIRVAERKIDTVLDSAILDYETLEDFDDVRFEGEWTLFRSFGTTKKRRELPKGSAVFAEHNGMTDNLAVADGSASPGLLGSLRDNIKAKSPLRAIGRPSSMQDLRGAAKAAKAAGQEVIADGLASAQAALGRNSDPRKITTILSSVLLVLQLYEVNPAFVVQVFSQVFFWISCEIFNRVLTRKKYLCRSKAVQIRMNITAIEDWTRSNGLPPKIASKHLEPVMQLLQWLQCSSQVKDFDTLIGTMQSLKAINPLQMRRAVRDYRFEVNEGRMSEECIQYLAQLQKDWERRRIQMSAQAMNPEIVNSMQSAGNASITTPGTTPDSAEGSTPIDALFDGSISLSDFIPQTAPDCLGELLDSRFMLPFLIPAETEYLIATPAPEAAYSNLVLESPFLNGDGSQSSSRPSSRSSFSSTRPMEWSLPSPKKLRHLPDDFFSFLRKVQMNRRLDWDALRAKKDTAEAAQRMAAEAEAATPIATEKMGQVSAVIDLSQRQRLINGNSGKISPSLPPLSEDDVETTPTTSTFFQGHPHLQPHQQYPLPDPTSPVARVNRGMQNLPQTLMSSPKMYQEIPLPSSHPFARTASPLPTAPLPSSSSAMQNQQQQLPPGVTRPELSTRSSSQSISQTSSIFSGASSQPSTPVRSTFMQSSPSSPSSRSINSYGQIQNDPRRISTLSNSTGYPSSSSGYLDSGIRFANDNVDLRLRGAVNSLYMPMNHNGINGSNNSFDRVFSPSAPSSNSAGNHYELARHRRERQNSMGSISIGPQSTTYGGGGGGIGSTTDPQSPPPLGLYTYSTSSGGIGGGKASPQFAPKSPASSVGSESGKKTWWKTNRKTSSSSSSGH